jgi:hypothetical protein
MITKVWLHTYVQHDGERVPWKVSTEREKLAALKSDDRIEEVWVLSDDALQEIKRQEAQGVLGMAQQYCESIATTDIKTGEICTGFQLLEHLEEMLK